MAPVESKQVHPSIVIHEVSARSKDIVCVIFEQLEKIWQWLNTFIWNK